MADLFFYGTLRDHDVLDIVSGDPGLFKRAQPASLPGWHAETVRGTTYPMLMEGNGPCAGLFVMNISGVIYERIKLFEHGYLQRTFMIDVKGRKRKGSVFVGGPGMRASGEAWDLSAWQQTDKRAFIGKIT